MAEKIMVIIKEPGKAPRPEKIPNTLKAFQKAVGGYIETVSITQDMVIICNEEGRLQGMAPSCNVCGVEICGTIVFAGVNADEFTDIPCTNEEFNKLFPQLWRYKQ